MQGGRVTDLFFVCTLHLPGFLHSRQKLALTDVQKQMAEVPPKEFQDRGSLQYQFGSELLQLPVHLFKIKNVESQVKFSHWTDSLLELGICACGKQCVWASCISILLQIEESLQDLVETTSEQLPSDAPAKALKLMHLFRAANEEDYESVWKQFSSRPAYRYKQYKQWFLCWQTLEDHLEWLCSNADLENGPCLSHYRRYILDIIPAVASHRALRFLRHKMEKQELTNWEAAQALLVALHSNTPTRYTMEEATVGFPRHTLVTLYWF